MTASEVAPETLHVIGERCRAVFPLFAHGGFDVLLSQLNDVEPTVTIEVGQSGCTPSQPGNMTLPE